MTVWGNIESLFNFRCAAHRDGNQANIGTSISPSKNNGQALYNNERYKGKRLAVLDKGNLGEFAGKDIYIRLCEPTTHRLETLPKGVNETGAPRATAPLYICYCFRKKQANYL